MNVLRKLSLGFSLTALGLWSGLSAQTAAPTNLTVDTVRDKQVGLSWDSPEQVYGIFDDFEGHEDFAINSPGKAGWQYLDMDNDNVYAIGDYAYADRGKPSAFQIWNPSQTVPPYSVGRGFPHSGQKCLISFATVSNYRNDWIVSPDLSGFKFDDTIRLSFWARTFNGTYGLEKINVGYSTTDMANSSFKFLNRTPIEVPEARGIPEMFYFEYKFPANAKYIAINCVTTEGQALLIDDIAIGLNKVMPNHKAKAGRNLLVGYNVYRNSTKANSQLVTMQSFTDQVPDYGTFAYTVEAVYQDGTTKTSLAKNVEVPDIHALPFRERWDSYNFEENFWSTNPDKENSGWSVDYREGGLIIPAATFKPTASLQNYSDYWLESKELKAQGLDGVMLAFDMAFWRYNLSGGGSEDEYIKVEVWDGSQWRTVATISSARNTFDYTRFYYDITEYVKGKTFKIRFNGGGRDAWSVHGWYISYVKVYEKQKATVSGTVTHAGSPVAGAAITWTSQDEDVYKAVSGTDGTYSITDVDAGNYTVKATKKAYNDFTGTTPVSAGSKLYDITMTAPAVAGSSNVNHYELVAEATTEGQITLQNTGDGPVRVSISPMYENGAANLTPIMKPLLSFRPSDIQQAAICFDGTYFYMARSDEFADGTIWKYDRDGNYINSFQPSIHVRSYFGMAFDGVDFYTANNDSIIRRIDFNTGKILEEIVTPIENINHIAYDETRDAFYVGCLNTIALVSRTGAVIEKETLINDVVFAGAVYDPYFKEGPTMWIMDKNTPNNEVNTHTLAVIRRLDLTTKTVKKDYVFDCSELPGFVWASSSTGYVYGEGLFGSTRYIDGHFVLMGLIISDPGLAFVLDMYEIDKWVKPSTYRVDIEAGESKNIPYTLDAADLHNGDLRKANLNIAFEPGIPSVVHKVELQVTGKAPLAKPAKLNAVALNDNAAVLTWQAPDGTATPTSYKIYRDGQAVGTANTTTYTDNNLKAGIYTYEVSAVYAGGESKKIKAKDDVEIYVGIPCYMPQMLTARNVRNESIALKWSDPTAAGTLATVIRHDNGIIYDYCGMYDGSSFIGATEWAPTELTDYRNMRISAVSFVPMTAKGTYSIVIYENGTQVYEQAVTASFTYGELLTVTLDKQHTINCNKSLRVGIKAGKGSALGVDNGPAVEARGNWLWTQTYGWQTMAVMGGADANFNIALNLLPKDKPETNTAKSYNVYRNGVKINTAPVTALNYSDAPATPGVYAYQVSAVHDNCESNLSAAATAQIIDIRDHDVPEDLSARVVMNRDVNLHWNYPNTNAGNNAKAGWKPFAYVKDFDLQGSGEAAIVTDGRFIYTSFVNRNGIFNKYDMQGNFIESFAIQGVGAIYDLTYDGTYFYGGSGKTELYRMDFQNHLLVNTMTVTEPVRHCAYIPDLDGGKGGFEIGDWVSSFFVSMTGAYLAKGFFGIDGAFGSAYYDGKLYYAQQGQTGRCEVIEVDFNTLRLTGNNAHLNKYTQYTLNEDARSGGLDAYMSPNGSAILMANLQNGSSPDKAVWVEISENAYVTGFNLYRDGKKVNNTPLTERDYADVITTPGTYKYRVSAIYIDEVESGQSSEISVTIVEPKHCEAPANVRVGVKDRDVMLQWTSVIDDMVNKDDMEMYSNLTTGQIGAYKTIDADHQPTYTPTNWSFNGAGMPGSFLVLDQRLLNPAQNDLAYSGNKFLAAFSANGNGVTATSYSHDWLIMPSAISSDKPQWISFMARGLETGGLESFRIAYSLNGIDTVDFIRVMQKPVEANCIWTRFIYDLPAGVKYVAIEYLSDNGRALLIDDITISDGTCVFRPEDDFMPNGEFVEKVAGYSIYRDGTLLTPEPIQANAYFDGNMPNGTYTYTIKALYNTSCLSPASDAVKAKVAYRAPMSAPRNLAGKANRGGKVSLTWDAPAYADDKLLSYAGEDLSTAFGYSEDAVYYAAQHWEPGELLGVFGYRIESVSALFAETPSKLDLVIFQNNELVYEQNVTEACQALDITVFKLNEPFEVDYRKSLTVGFRIEAIGGTYTIAVDKGPAVSNKGDLYSDNGETWISGDYFYGTGGNWFISAVMKLPVPANADMNGFQGYLVYRDGDPVRKELITETKYTDEVSENGTHTYAVSAVYTGGEKKSKTISVKVTGVANEELDGNRLYLFPNPTSDYFTVEGAFDRIEVADLQGKVWLNHEAAQGAVVSVATLAPGVYFVRILSEAGITIRKLVVK